MQTKYFGAYAVYRSIHVRIWHLHLAFGFRTHIEDGARSRWPFVSMQWIV
jgi:hypothetical protein